MRRSFALTLTLFVLLWLLVAIACEQVPAGFAWPVAFGALTIPVALMGTVLAALYWLRRRRWLVALLPIGALVLTWPHFERGLALHPFRSRAKSVVKDQPFADGQTLKTSFFAPAAKSNISVLSANVRIFNTYAELSEPGKASSKNFIRWLADSPADIICLQEFYDEPEGSQANGQIFRSAKYIGPDTGRQPFTTISVQNSINGRFGLALFSRFPIVHRGRISFGKRNWNHAIWADVVRPAPLGDTLRIFNVHFQSMGLGEDKIVAAASTKTGLRHQAPGLLRRFRKGAIARAWQVDTLLARIAHTRYPVLLAGDCNDLPFSYTYDQLADHLQNAWATSSTGLGATYNGRLRAMRIDNQFVSKEWEVLGCRVHREIPWSDHFPVEGLYDLKK